MDALIQLWLQTQAGLECSYAHICRDGSSLGAVVVGAVNNIGACIQALVK